MCCSCCCCCCCRCRRKVITVLTTCSYNCFPPYFRLTFSHSRSFSSTRFHSHFHSAHYYYQFIDMPAHVIKFIRCMFFYSGVCFYFCDPVNRYISLDYYSAFFRSFDVRTNETESERERERVNAHSMYRKLTINMPYIILFIANQ